jgi:hypothetical protein
MEQLPLPFYLVPVKHRVKSVGYQPVHIKLWFSNAGNSPLLVLVKDRGSKKHELVLLDNLTESITRRVLPW